MKKLVIQIVVLFCAAILYAQDVVVFQNGDTLTGKILERDDTQLRFKSGFLGTVELQMQDIAELRTNVIATAVSEETEEKFGPEPHAVETSKKSTWNGHAGLAFALRDKSYSNSSGIYKNEQYQTYRLYGGINWTGEKNRLNWNWNYRYSVDETKVRDDYFNLVQKYNHILQSGYYAEAKSMYQRDYSRQIENEYLQTAEIGKNWFARPHFQFSTSIGGSYHQYERNRSGGSTITGEPKFIFDGALRWKAISSLTLFQKYTHLGNFEKYHFVSSSGLENKLIRNVFLRMEYRIDRDTETAYDDRGYYDKSFLTSLFYEF